MAASWTLRPDIQDGPTPLLGVYFYQGNRDYLHCLLTVSNAAKHKNAE
jgi:hypothetical protein